MRGGRSAAIAAVAVLLFGGATLRRQAAWDSELALWSDVARKSPRLPEARLNLALALREAGRPAEAETELRAALAIDPEHAGARNNLGNLLAGLGRLDEAGDELRAAWERKPSAGTALNLGNVAMRERDATEAERWYREARSRGNDGVELRFNLAKSMLAQRRGADAAALYATLADSLPGSAPFANDYGCALLLSGDAEGAARELRRAVELRPDWDDARRNLERARAAAGRPTTP
ncbi:tetratricopeptide repeat protein [bacterium]|nr:tetratricopeptide repeat protein [bacterium]